jgi:hypothetical protein
MTSTSVPASLEILKQRKSFVLLFLLLLIPILAAHLFRLAEIPSGLYLDEASIGYNAILLAETGRDEHGVFLPVYPESVGDYKNPAFVYAAAGVLKVIGVSEFSLRFVSVLFFLAALALTLLLVERLFQGNPITRLYALAVFGFLPIFFTISRIAFEVIAQLAWIPAVLLMIWAVFHEEHSSRETIKTILCGIALGTSTYTYSTGRLLAFLSLALLWVIYFNRDNFKKLAIITTSFAVSLIPFLFFTIRNPGAITSRFNALSYLGESIPLSEKIAIFFQNYFTYFSPRFLIFNGDPNLRHSTGFGGVVFISVFLLSMIGLMGILIRRKWTRFNIFLLVSLLLSLVAAALTSEGTPHALRSMTLGIYLFLLSCHGMDEFLRMENRRARTLMLTGISIFLLAEIVLYQMDYFLAYPARSVKAMGSQGFESALQFAIDQSPGEVIFFSKPRETYANMQFYSLLVENPNDVPLNWDNRPKPDKNICILYHVQNERELDSSPIPFEEFDSGGIIKARCYLP